jgi:hypothetical protein
MSDTMLLGVLRMPPGLWDNGPIDVMQRHSRYLEAADRIEKQKCKWGLIVGMEDMNDIYETHCGYIFDGNHSPHPAGMRFCPFCGNKIDVKGAP